MRVGYYSMFIRHDVRLVQASWFKIQREHDVLLVMMLYLFKMQGPV